MPIYITKHKDANDDVPVMEPSRQPHHISWCEDCSCYLNNRGVNFVMVKHGDEFVQLCPRCADED